MLAEMTEANEKYTMKRYINMHIAFIIQKSLERVWHVEKYLKMLDFPKKLSDLIHIYFQTVYMYENGFGIKQPTMVDMP